jgi:hypothetical protein
MIDPRDLRDKDDEWVSRMVEDPIRRQQRKRRRKTFRLIGILCIIALVVGAVIGWRM